MTFAEMRVVEILVLQQIPWSSLVVIPATAVVGKRHDQ
jgi:hypothetical protein